MCEWSDLRGYAYSQSKPSTAQKIFRSDHNEVILGFVLYMRSWLYVLFLAPGDLPGFFLRSYVCVVVTADKHASNVSSNKYSSLLLESALFTLDNASDCLFVIFDDEDLISSCNLFSARRRTMRFYLITPINYGVYIPPVFAIDSSVRYPFGEVNMHHSRQNHTRKTILGEPPYYLTTYYPAIQRRTYRISCDQEHREYSLSTIHHINLAFVCNLARYLFWPYALSLQSIGSRPSLVLARGCLRSVHTTP